MVSLEGDNLMQKDINETLKFFDEIIMLILSLLKSVKKLQIT
jgi:hypothetical protein